jgi:hypothetical protein
MKKITLIFAKLFAGLALTSCLKENCGCDPTFDQINSVRDGEVVDYDGMMADAGTGVLSAWYFNEKAGKYESVFLASNGDVNQINSHSSVDEIVDWLKSVGERTDHFYWYGGK